MDTSAAADGFRMPAEWTPHERTWMAWPGPNPTFDDARTSPRPAGPGRTWPGDRAASSRSPWCAARARPPRRPGPARPGHRHRRARTRRRLDARHRPHLPHRRQGRLAAVDWTFNGWGAQDWARWEHDAKIAALCRRTWPARPTYASQLVNEGGASTSTARARSCSPRPCSSDPSRNPGWTSEQVEAEIHAQLGTTQGDLAAARTDRRLPAARLRHPRPCRHRRRLRPPRRRRRHSQPDPAHPDHEVCKEIIGAAAGPDRRPGPPPGGRRGPRPDGPGGGRPLGRLLLHQPLPLQRRRRALRLRRPARRDRGRDLPPAVPRADGDAGRRPYDLRGRWRHPLHHPAAAEGLIRSRSRRHGWPRCRTPACPRTRGATRPARGRARRRHGHDRRARSGEAHHGGARPRGRHEQRPPPLLLPLQGRAAAADPGVERGPARRRARAAARPARPRPANGSTRTSTCTSPTATATRTGRSGWRSGTARRTPTPTRRERQAAIEGAWHRDLVALLAEGISRGEFRPVDPDRFAARLRALLDGFSIHVAIGLPRHGPRASPRPRKGVPGRVARLPARHPAAAAPPRPVHGRGGGRRRPPPNPARERNARKYA